MSISSPLIILGMHRSGTSTLAGSLEQAGLSLGDVVRRSPDNPKGNRESRWLIALHEDILERNGGSWRAPAPKHLWSPVHKAMRDLYVKSLAEREPWGFKDPRTLLVLGGWLAAVPEATLVGIFRHPFHVAESLRRRNAIPHEEGLALWTSYNRVLLWYHDKHGPFPLLEFADEAADVVTQLRALADALGLDGAPMDFFDDAIRRPVVPDLAEHAVGRAALGLHERLRARRTFPPTNGA